MQMQGPILEPQSDISSPSVVAQLVSKTPKFSIFSRDSTQNGEVSFEQWAFDIKSVMHSHMEVTLKEGIVWSLCGAAADQVWYLGLPAPV